MPLQWLLAHRLRRAMESPPSWFAYIPICSASTLSPCQSSSLWPLTRATVRTACVVKGGDMCVWGSTSRISSCRHLPAALHLHGWTRTSAHAHTDTKKTGPEIHARAVVQPLTTRAACTYMHQGLCHPADHQLLLPPQLLPDLRQLNPSVRTAARTDKENVQPA